jgi:hypothetical protein
MVGMLFGLFLWNSNGELRRTTVISSLHRNSKIAAILIAPEQWICVWLHCCYLYSDNNSYSVMIVSSKHTRVIKNYLTSLPTYCRKPRLSCLTNDTKRNCCKTVEFSAQWWETRRAVLIDMKSTHLRTSSHDYLALICKKNQTLISSTILPFTSMNSL